MLVGGSERYVVRFGSESLDDVDDKDGKTKSFYKYQRMQGTGSPRAVERTTVIETQGCGCGF